MAIQCSTKVCSFGKQVVEKLETEYAKFENGRFVYKIQRSPMCEYMINFIHKLKHLPEKYMMNSVLENFTILQVRMTSFFNPPVDSGRKKDLNLRPFEITSFKSLTIWPSPINSGKCDCTYVMLLYHHLLCDVINGISSIPGDNKS